MLEENGRNISESNLGPQANQEPAGGKSLSLAGSLILFSWLAIVTTLGFQVITPNDIETYALYPLLLGMVILGLPHGALDHLLPSRSGVHWGRNPLWLAVYLSLYISLAVGYFCLWLWWPELAFIGFLFVTIMHWGQGDQRFMEIFLGRLRPTRWGAQVTLWVRGALPVVLPVWAFPETAESLFRYATTGLGLRPITLELSWPQLAVPLLIGFGLVLFSYLLNAVRAAPTAVVLAVDLLELVLLTAFFTRVPAYLSIGIYFACWHSLKHLARLLILQSGSLEQIAQGQLHILVRQLTLALMPLTLIALALLGGIYFWSAARVTTLEGFVALYLVLISSLTLPHTVVVALLDVWEPGTT